jgi:hypothetical protein
MFSIGENLENWKTVAFVGAIVFLISGFLPLISSSLFDFSFWYSLINLYASLGQTVETGAGAANVSVGSIGILLTIILYPVAIILGFVSIARRKVALAAGILGIICWIGAMAAINEILSGIPDLGSPLQYVGLSAYIGFIGSIILIIASVMKPSGIPRQAAPPAPAPPPPVPP